MSFDEITPIPPRVRRARRRPLSVSMPRPSTGSQDFVWIKIPSLPLLMASAQFDSGVVMETEVAASTRVGFPLPSAWSGGSVNLSLNQEQLNVLLMSGLVVAAGFVVVKVIEVFAQA